MSGDKTQIEIDRLKGQLNSILQRRGVKQTIGRKQPTPDPQPAANSSPSPPAEEAPAWQAKRDRKEDQRSEIVRALRLFHAPGEVFEIRILKARVNGRAVTMAGFFNDVDAAVEAALRWDNKAEGLYHSMNRIHDGLLARAPNKLVQSLEPTTADRDVIRRKAILLDFDPERPRGISSSAEELELAREVARSCYHWLKEQGIDSIIASSGNGFHTVVPVDLGNDAESTQLVKRFLEVMAQRFNTDRVKVDTAVHNLSRIIKLWGTIAAKGTSTDERPHRRAKLVKDECVETSRELLEKIVAASPADSQAQPPASASPELQAVLTALEQRGITVKEPIPYKDGLKYTLSECLFNPDHQGGTSVTIIEYASGAKSYSCFHSECNGKKKWRDVLMELQPQETRPDGKQKPSVGQPSRVVIAELPDVRKLAAERVEFLVPGLLVTGAITLFSGPPGSGKTTLLLWLGDAVARGGEILGGPCAKCPVLYVTREMPLQFAADISKRFKIANGEGTNLFMFGPWNTPSALTSAATSILEFVSQCDSPPLIIFDPMVAFLPEGSSENDSVEIRRFFGMARTLLAAGAAGIVFLHHTGKSETAQQYRGSSDILASVDAAYHVSNSGDCVLDRIVLKLFKPRFFEQKRELVLRYSENNGIATFTSDERKDAPRITISAQLRNLLEVMPCCKTTEFISAAKAKGIPNHIARSYLINGEDSGDIVVDKGPRNAKYHRLKDSTLFTPDDGGTVQ